MLPTWIWWGCQPRGNLEKHVQVPKPREQIKMGKAVTQRKAASKTGNAVSCMCAGSWSTGIFLDRRHGTGTGAKLG